MIQDRSRKVQNVPDLVEQFAQLLLPGEFSAHWQMFSETWRAVASHYSIGLIRMRLFKISAPGTPRVGSRAAL
jgi:hypothetical protein